jgi:dienelactone hydrolase
MIAWFFLLSSMPYASAEIHEFPGGKELPHEKYIHVVPESVSPVERLFIKSKDGLYVAAALRKPKGNGPFPVLVHFHGAPGGRGMEQLAGWARGDHGSPVHERFLQEGYVVVVADYRGGQNLSRLGESAPAAVSFVDDAEAVITHVQRLPYADPERISVYGVSLGGDVVMHLLGRMKLHSAILGAPAPISFLGARPNAGAPAGDRWKDAPIDAERAQRGIEAIETPILILVGTADSLIVLDRRLHDLLEKAGKRVRMEIYANGYHDFCIGPQGQGSRKEPLLDATLAALESSLAFVKSARAPAR